MGGGTKTLHYLGEYSITVTRNASSRTNTLNIDCTSINGYKDMTANDFAVGISNTSLTCQGTVSASSDRSGYFNNPTWTYTASTGTLTVSCSHLVKPNGYSAASQKLRVYYVA